MSKFTCPVCGTSLNLEYMKSYTVDEETGKLEIDWTQFDVNCTGCDWDGDASLNSSHILEVNPEFKG